MSDETLDLLIDEEPVPGGHHLPGRRHGHLARRSRAAGQGGRGLPRAKATIRKAIARGARIACGTDAPAIPHGRNAKELARARRPGHDARSQAIRAATTVAAELIDVDDRGRLEAGLLADIIAVPGDPLTDIGVTEDVRFVMKGGQVYHHDRPAG